MMTFNSFAKIDREFVNLCLATDNLLGKGTLIDSYCGEQIEFSKNLSLNDIIKRFLYLKEIILDNVDDIFPLYKKTYLVSHINAIITQIELFQGRTFGFNTAINNLYDITSSPPSLNNIIAIHDKLSELLCEKGIEHESLKQRVLIWKQNNSITTEKFVDRISHSLEYYKKKSFELFNKGNLDNLNNIYHKDTVVLDIVDTEQGWAAYNNYLYNYNGRIEFNSSAKFNQYSINTFLTHEAYPGHHFSSLLKEYLYKHNHIENYAVLNLLKTPSSLIEEGIGDCGLKILGLSTSSIDDEIEKALDDLSAEVDYLVAKLVYDKNTTKNELYDILLNYKFMKDKDDADRSLQFIENWTLYVPIYKFGRELINNYVDNHSADELIYLYYPCTTRILNRIDENGGCD